MMCVSQVFQSCFFPQTSEMWYFQIYLKYSKVLNDPEPPPMSAQVVTFGAVLNACRGAQQLDVVERLLQALENIHDICNIR